MSLECYEVECDTRMFTVGKKYPIVRSNYWDSVTVRDDLGHERTMSLHKNDGSAGFCIRNDSARGTTNVKHAYFRSTHDVHE